MLSLELVVVGTYWRRGAEVDRRTDMRRNVRTQERECKVVGRSCDDPQFVFDGAAWDRLKYHLNCPFQSQRLIQPATLYTLFNEYGSNHIRASWPAKALRLGAIRAVYLPCDSSRTGRPSLIPSRATVICFDFR